MEAEMSAHGLLSQEDFTAQSLHGVKKIKTQDQDFAFLEE
jgi:hypothetical protein